MNVKEKTKSRRAALQFLYQIDIRGQEVLSHRETFLKENDLLGPLKEYAETLIDGCLDHWEELNTKIMATTKNWTMDRMPVIDRNILRIAIYELMYRKDVPSVVVINEAIELGKTFSTQQSGSFINGILDKVAKYLEEKKT